MKHRTSQKPVAYVSFSTLLSALDNLKVAPMSAGLDRESCGAFSGSTWGQLCQTLRFLDLLDEEDVRTDLLKSLVESSDRKRIFRKILKTHYPELFAADLSRVSLARLDKMLAAFRVRGATLRKARSFFLGAAKYSGVELSAPLAKTIRHRVKRKRPSAQSETQRYSRAPNAPEHRSSVYKTVSLAVTDLTLTLSFPGSFAELEKTDREHFYRLLDELVSYRRTAQQKGSTASPGSETNPLDALDNLSDDSNDEPVH